MRHLPITSTTARDLVSLGRPDVWTQLLSGFAQPVVRSLKGLLSLLLYQESKWKKQADARIRTWGRNVPWGLNYETSNICVIQYISEADVSF